MTEAEKDRLGLERFFDAAMMDWGNRCLEKWDARQGIPKGKLRYQNELWAAHLKNQLVDASEWAYYREWCLRGGGDEWFVTDDDFCSDE